MGAWGVEGSNDVLKDFKGWNSGAPDDYGDDPGVGGSNYPYAYCVVILKQSIRNFLS